MNQTLNPMIKIHKFMFLAHKMLDKELLKLFGISFSQFRILAAVLYHPGISQRQIADFEELTEAAVSRHIAGLTTKGYIVLVPNTKNKKQHILELTKSGKILSTRAMAVVEEKGEMLLGSLSLTEQNTISKSFDTLIDKVRSDTKMAFDCPVAVTPTLR